VTIIWDGASNSPLSRQSTSQEQHQGKRRKRGNITLTGLTTSEYNDIRDLTSASAISRKFFNT